MINIDFLTLKAFFEENKDFITGSNLRKIQQPTRREFVLTLRNKSENKKLYINLYPEIYHIAFMSPENEIRRGLKIPKQPPMFCMLLRKYLEGGKVSAARVVTNDRILELYFNITDEFYQKKELCLAIELMGKHSNVILYDKNSSVIIGCAHNVGAEKSRYRELQGGLKYIYPPYSGSLRLSDELQKQFENLSQENINKYLETNNFAPATLDDRYTLFRELIPNSIPQNSVNKMLDNYYSAFQEKYNLSNTKNTLINNISGKLKKVKTSKSKIKSLLQKRDKTDLYKLYGELLTSNLYLKADFQNKIEVFDYINNKNIIIDLDPTKTMNENAQRYFKLYTKSKTTKEKSEDILQGLNIEENYLESLLYSIDSATKTGELEEIKSELGINEAKTDKKFTPDINKVSVKGFDVYIGKNNKQNDYIISKLAKDDDYWFHTRTCAGSHVLLKVQGHEPDESVLFECAKLARQFSSAKQPSKVGVIYTRRKYIKKPPAAPLGYVIYRNEKEILV